MGYRPTKCEPCREIQFRSFAGPAAEEVKNASKWKGITKSAFMSGLVKEILAEFPEHMKSPYKGQAKMVHNNLMSGVAESSREQLLHVARYIGVDLGDLLKIKIMDHVLKLPAHMRTQFIDD